MTTAATTWRLAGQQDWPGSVALLLSSNLPASNRAIAHLSYFYGVETIGKVIPGWVEGEAHESQAPEDSLALLLTLR